MCLKSPLESSQFFTGLPAKTDFCFLTQIGKEGSLFSADEETAEALRRWDAGIRVENVEEFQRKIVSGHWQIVNASTENPLNGMDVVFSNDWQ